MPWAPAAPLVLATSGLSGWSACASCASLTQSPSGATARSSLSSSSCRMSAGRCAGCSCAAWSEGSTPRLSQASSAAWHCVTACATSSVDCTSGGTWCAGPAADSRAESQPEPRAELHEAVPLLQRLEKPGLYRSRLTTHLAELLPSRLAAAAKPRPVGARPPRPREAVGSMTRRDSFSRAKSRVKQISQPMVIIHSRRRQIRRGERSRQWGARGSREVHVSRLCRDRVTPLTNRWLP